MKVRAKSVPNDGVGLKKILVFVFDDAEKRESQRNHWGYGVETFFFSRLGFVEGVSEERRICFQRYYSPIL
jgi:hypothetical protein